MADPWHRNVWLIFLCFSSKPENHTPAVCIQYTCSKRTGLQIEPPKPEGHIMTSARFSKRSLLLTRSCSSSNWSHWYLENSPSITYWEALQYLQKGILPSHQKMFGSYLSTAKSPRRCFTLRNSRLARQTEGIDRTKWILLLGSFGGKRSKLKTFDHEQINVL